MRLHEVLPTRVWLPDRVMGCGFCSSRAQVILNTKGPYVEQPDRQRVPGVRLSQQPCTPLRHEQWGRISFRLARAAYLPFAMHGLLVIYVITKPTEEDFLISWQSGSYQ